MRYQGVVVAVVALAFSAGCDLFGPDGERVMGVIGSEEVGSPQAGTSVRASVSAEDRPGWMDVEDFWDRPPLEAPDTVTAGEPFEIIVRTSGMGGCWQPDGQRIKAMAGVIEVTPFDRVAGPNCLGADWWLERTAEVVFNDPGKAVLRLTGRILLVGDSVQGERVGSIDFPVHVR